MKSMPDLRITFFLFSSAFVLTCTGKNCTILAYLKKRPFMGSIPQKTKQIKEKCHIVCDFNQ